ncbi:Asp23/Gls24 family envelope stress response protein [Fervidobacterium sp.]
MGYLEINSNVYQEIAYKSICEFLGVEDNNKFMNFKKGNVLVEKLQSGTDQERELVKFIIQLPAKFGSSFLDFSDSVACHVKKSVEDMTGMVVESVNIKISDVIFEQENL